MNRAPASLFNALQSVNVQSVIDRSPALSTSRLTAPPFIPALQDVNVMSLSESEAEEDTLKHKAPPLSLLDIQDVKERLERENEFSNCACITPPSPPVFWMEVNVVLERESVAEMEGSSFDEENDRRV